MGIKSSIYEIEKILKTYNDYLIISLLDLETIKTKFKDFETLELGEILSSELIKIDKNKRNIEVVKTMGCIFSKIDASEIIVTNIDILFNPSYRLDIIKLFIQLSRNKTVIVQWPGKLDLNNLIYSEPKYEDYKKYEINNYNIICLR